MEQLWAARLWSNSSNGTAPHISSNGGGISQTDDADDQVANNNIDDGINDHDDECQVENTYSIQ